MKIYVQIDENAIVAAISQVKDTIDNPDMIEIQEYDESIVGKKYENGVFVDVPVEPYVPTYDEEKKKYLNLIRDAKDLGEDAEVDRLKMEWYNLKATNGWLQEGEQPPTATASVEELGEVVDTMLGEGGTV